jgi:hypothetical protein
VEELRGRGGSGHTDGRTGSREHQRLAKDQSPQMRGRCAKRAANGDVAPSLAHVSWPGRGSAHSC